VIHRRAHRGEFDGSTDDRERAPAVDHRLDADRLVDLRSGYQWTGRGGRGQRRRGSEQHWQRERVAHLKQLSTCDAL